MDINHAPWIKERYPKVCRIGGFALFILGIAFLGGGIYYQDLFTILQGVLALFGIWELNRQYSGRDSLISTLFPRFVQIDALGITHKGNGLRRAQFYAWEELSEIQEKHNSIHLHRENSSKGLISLKDVDYKELRKFKEVLKAMAHKAHIPYKVWKE